MEAVAWRQGWWALARHCPSPNVGLRPVGQAVSLVVLHSISLPPGRYGTGDIERLFLNQLDWDADPYFQAIRGLQVSSHFVVARNGDVTQFASCDDRAWHAGRSSWQGRDNCNDYSIGVELEGLEGETFESAQYQALQALLLAVAQAYPVQQVAGHEHVAPGRKQDPGTGFDWPRLQASLGWPDAAFPPGVRGRA
jgi:N-acetyl-anhydromuramoyl-L-alanine amidase